MISLNAWWWKKLYNIHFCHRRVQFYRVLMLMYCLTPHMLVYRPAHTMQPVVRDMCIQSSLDELMTSSGSAIACWLRIYLSISASRRCVYKPLRSTPHALFLFIAFFVVFLWFIASASANVQTYNGRISQYLNVYTSTYSQQRGSHIILYRLPGIYRWPI